MDQTAFGELPESIVDAIYRGQGLSVIDHFHRDPRLAQARERRFERSALHCLIDAGEAMDGAQACFDVLLALSDANAEDRTELTPLMMASRRGHLPWVNALLPVSEVNRADVNGFTALTYAAQQGNREVLSRLIPLGDLQQRDGNGYGLLENTVPNLDCLQLLLAAGAEKDGVRVGTVAHAWMMESYHGQGMACTDVLLSQLSIEDITKMFVQQTGCATETAALCAAAQDFPRTLARLEQKALSQELSENSGESHLQPRVRSEPNDATEGPPPAAMAMNHGMGFASTPPESSAEEPAKLSTGLSLRL